MTDFPHHLSASIRALSVAMVERANSGHPGLPLGASDIAAVLFSKYLHFSPDEPLHPCRDRFILSAGHGSALLYSLLYLLGYKGFDDVMASLGRFRQLHAITAGHPEYLPESGIETTTGPLAQGLGNGVGMAIGLQKLFAKNPEAMPYVYVLLGDGCLMEGLSEEAISLAGRMALHNLILLFDDNHISIDGKTDLATITDQMARLKANGFHTWAVDGHDSQAVDKAIGEAKTITDKPSFIACRTTIGKFAPNKAGTAGVHGSPLGQDEMMAVLKSLQIPDPEKFLTDFILPDAWRQAWRDIAMERGRALQMRAKKYKPAELKINNDMAKSIMDYKTKVISENKPIATRVSSQQSLATLLPHLPMLVGGSADLTGSNGTMVKGQVVISPAQRDGQYIHYGVREHGMASAMNGLAQVGLIPYGGSFLVFSDYLRPSLRLSALMRQKVIYVLTHDSIGLGEDGPTHQPIEHLASLRAIPHLLVLRPADAIETMEAWQVALDYQGPSVLALSRQNLPLLRQDLGDNQTMKGGYMIYGDEGNRKLTLLATGSEVHLAVESAKKLGDGVAVVSMPSFELFQNQTDDYKNKILGQAPMIAIEAGIKQAWYQWLKSGDEFIGLDDFGESAPAMDIYQARGITMDNIVKTGERLLKK